MPENDQSYGGYPDPSMPQGGQSYGYPDPAMQQGGQPAYGYPDPSMQPQPGMPQQPMPQQQMQPNMPQQPAYGYPDPSMQPQPGMPPYGTPPKKKGIGVGAIIAIVAGVVAVAVIVGFLLLGNRGSDNVVPDNGGSGQTTGQTTGSGSSSKPSSGTSSSTGTDTGTSSADAGTTSGDRPQGEAPAGTEGQQPAPAAPAPAAAPASNDWLSGEFTLDGKSFTLMQSGYRDLEADGWALDEATQSAIDNQYGGAYMMNLNDRLLSTLGIVKGTESGVSIRVANLDSGAKDFRDCTLTSIEVLEPLAYTGNAAPAFVVPGGGTIGMTPEQIVGIYGEPKDRYESEGYASYTYGIEGDYLKELRFSFSEGKVNNIAYELG